jgi:hypothetical protein
MALCRRNQDAASRSITELNPPRSSSALRPFAGSSIQRFPIDDEFLLVSPGGGSISARHPPCPAQFLSGQTVCRVSRLTGKDTVPIQYSPDCWHGSWHDHLEVSNQVTDLCWGQIPSTASDYAQRD